MRGDGTVYRRGSVFWIKFFVNGQPKREPGGPTEGAARRKLRERLSEAHCGLFVNQRQLRLTVDELLDAYIEHLRLKGSKSPGSVKSHLKPIRVALGHLRATQVNATHIERYQRDRRADGFANATINRGVEALRAALRLAHRQERLSRVPYLPILREDNVRRGFFEADEFVAVVENLPPVIADAARFAYLSGWRKSEISGLRWEHVDREAREVRLFDSKNGEGRVLPLVGALWELIELRWERREYSRNDVASLAVSVFHQDGRPLKDFRRAWKAACKAAGVPYRLFHDFRRTAARDLVRSGVPETVAMSITGHKTRAIFDRYNITSTKDQREALEKNEAHRKTLATVRNMVPFECTSPPGIKN
jgi:integrase